MGQLWLFNNHHNLDTCDCMQIFAIDRIALEWTGYPLFDATPTATVRLMSLRIIISMNKQTIMIMTQCELAISIVWLAKCKQETETFRISKNHKAAKKAQQLKTWRVPLMRLWGPETTSMWKTLKGWGQPLVLWGQKCLVWPNLQTWLHKQRCWTYVPISLALGLLSIQLPEPPQSRSRASKSRRHKWWWVLCFRGQIFTNNTALPSLNQELKGTNSTPQTSLATLYSCSKKWAFSRRRWSKAEKMQGMKGWLNDSLLGRKFENSHQHSPFCAGASLHCDCLSLTYFLRVGCFVLS